MNACDRFAALAVECLAQPEFGGPLDCLGRWEPVVNKLREVSLKVALDGRGGMEEVCQRLLRVACDGRIEGEIVPDPIVALDLAGQGGDRCVGTLDRRHQRMDIIHNLAVLAWRGLTPYDLDGDGSGEGELVAGRGLGGGGGNGVGVSCRGRGGWDWFRARLS